MRGLGISGVGREGVEDGGECGGVFLCYCPVCGKRGLHGR